MYDSTEKNYAKFFGQNLLSEILQMDDDLAEEYKLKNQTKQVSESFETATALDLDEVLELDPEEITYLYENPIVETTSDYPRLHNFLHHLCSPWMHKTRSGKPGKKKYKMDEAAKPLDDIRAEGRKALEPHGNPWAHMKAGFHAAFPEGEHPKETAKKANEAQHHFKKFLHDRGGLSGKSGTMLSDNGKTRKSSGVGVKTVGLSMTPSTRSGYKHNLCPKATKECHKNCLGVTAGGNRQYPDVTMRAKLLRTHHVHEHPEHAARLIDHEITKNEKDAANVKTHHVGEHKFNSKKEAMAHIKKHGGKIDKTTANPHNSGVRMNVLSDIPYEHLMPKKFFDKHKKTQFYDYTKIPGRLHNEHKPENYHLSLSHTGANHPESNDKDVAHALKHGHVVASVYKRGKDEPHPTHMEDVQSGHRYPIANGDKDDNTFDRHEQLGIKHKNGVGIGEHSGVVSGLKLKGVNNDAAGKFANKVHKNGTIYFNHPKEHPDHWSHHPEEHPEHYKEHPEEFSRKHKDDKSPFHVLK